MKNPFLLILVIFCIGASAQNKQRFKFTIENDSTLIGFLKSKNLDFTPDQVGTLKNLRTFVENSRERHLTVPDAYFFNSKGELIKNKGKGETCGAEIKKLEKVAKLKSDPNQKLTDFLSDVTVLSGEDFAAQPADVYVVLTWARFLPAESEISFNWFNSLKRQNLNVKVLLLNFDIQQKWNVTPENQKALGIEP